MPVGNNRMASAQQWALHNNDNRITKTRPSRGVTKKTNAYRNIPNQRRAVENDDKSSLFCRRNATLLVATAGYTKSSGLARRWRFVLHS